MILKHTVSKCAMTQERSIIPRPAGETAHFAIHKYYQSTGKTHTDVPQNLLLQFKVGPDLLESIQRWINLWHLVQLLQSSFPCRGWRRWLAFSGHLRDPRLAAYSLTHYPFVACQARSFPLMLRQASLAGSGVPLHDSLLRHVLGWCFNLAWHTQKWTVCICCWLRSTLGMCSASNMGLLGPFSGNLVLLHACLSQECPRIAHLPNLSRQISLGMLRQIPDLTHAYP